MDEPPEPPRKNPTIPELPDEPVTLTEAVRPLFEPPIPPLHEFLEEDWWEAEPDSSEGQIKMLWLRYKQTAVALAVATKEIINLQSRVQWLEANQKSTVQ